MVWRCDATDGKVVYRKSKHGNERAVFSRLRCAVGWEKNSGFGARDEGYVSVWHLPELLPRTRLFARSLPTPPPDFKTMATTWAVEDEILLFGLVCERKPAGRAKKANMDWILANLTAKSGRSFLAADVWEKLLAYYDLNKVDELEEREDTDESADDDKNKTKTSKLADKFTEKTAKRTKTRDTNTEDDNNDDISSANDSDEDSPSDTRATRTRTRRQSVPPKKRARSTTTKEPDPPAKRRNTKTASPTPPAAATTKRRTRSGAVQEDEEKVKVRRSSRKK